MDCLSEIDLELLCLSELKGETPDSSHRSHLESCTFCRERFEQLRAFFHEFENLRAKSPSRSEIEFAGNIVTDRSQTVHIAYPLYFSTVLPPPNHMQSVLVAASSEVRSSSLFENLGVLATEDRDIIVRLIRSKKSGEVVLHLVSDSEEKYRNVLVMVSALDDEYITDENGKVNLGKVSLPDTRNLYARVQTPCATFTLAPVTIEGSRPGIVLSNEKKDSIKVELISGETDSALKVYVVRLANVQNKDRLKVAVIREKGKPLLSPVQKGVAGFEGFKKNGKLRIEVFD